MTGVSDIGLSIARTEILRALDDVRRLEGKLNRQLAEDDKPPEPQAFFTRDEVEQMQAEHAAELESLRPAKPLSHWQRQKQERAEQANAARGQPSPTSPFEAFGRALVQAISADAGQITAQMEASAVHALDMVEQALNDDRFDVSPMLKETLRAPLLVIPRDKPDEARQRAIESWLSLMASAWGSQRSAALEPSSVETADPDDAETDDAPDDDDAALDDNIVDLTALRAAGEKT
jgi:hypothetical protein